MRLALQPVRARGVLRHQDVGLQTGPGGVGRQGAAGIARRGHGQLPRSQRPGARNRHRQPASLEGAGGVERLVFHVEPLTAEFPAQVRQLQQRGAALAERHRFTRPAGQHFFVAPEVAPPAGQGFPGEGFARLLQVVPGQQRAAARAKVLPPVGRMNVPAAGALEAGERRSRHRGKQRSLTKPCRPEQGNARRLKTAC